MVLLINDIKNYNLIIEMSILIGDVFIFEPRHDISNNLAF